MISRIERRIKIKLYAGWGDDLIRKLVVKLNEEEQGLFNKSADAVRNMNDVLATLA